MEKTELSEILKTMSLLQQNFTEMTKPGTHPAMQAASLGYDTHIHTHMYTYIHVYVKLSHCAVYLILT